MGAQRGGATKGLAPSHSLPEGVSARKLSGINDAPPHTGVAKPNHPESAVNRAPILAPLALALGTALCAASALSVQAATPAAAPFKAPMAGDGHPDLSGFWSNASLTTERRPAKFADRLVYTPAEVKALEKGVQDEVKEGNKPTDPNAPAEAPKVDASKIRPEFAAAGG